jgi:hypothetical protein
VADDERAKSARGDARLRDLEALEVRDQQPRAAVVETVGELVGLPPGVHADRDAADREDRREGRDPLRIVPHRDRDAVAGADRVAMDQGVGDLVDAGHQRREGPRLVFVDEEGLVAVEAGEGEGFAHRLRQLGELLDRMTVDESLDDLEGRARARSAPPSPDPSSSPAPIGLPPCGARASRRACPQHT